MRKTARKNLRGAGVGRGVVSQEQLEAGGGLLDVLQAGEWFFLRQIDSPLLLSQTERLTPVTPTNENTYQRTQKHTEYLHR